MTKFKPVSQMSNVWSRKLEIYKDNRGSFSEISRINELPVNDPGFVQDSISKSRQKVLRGFHIQLEQIQLVTLISGRILDVFVDLSKSSNNFLETGCIELSENGTNQLLMGQGIAHAYFVMSDEAVIHYKSNKYYGETPQFGINYKSRKFAEFWPEVEFEVSQRDLNFPHFEEVIADYTFMEKFK
jgi:dTDP-4-dehydrorhamnose 3,5-epimerase